MQTGEGETPQYDHLSQGYSHVHNVMLDITSMGMPDRADQTRPGATKEDATYTPVSP
jgi:hypothetical protein